jgi:hypothetical protein
MKHAICRLPLIPLRNQPQETAAQVTQVLYGELIDVLAEANEWSQVQLVDDGYIGWCSSNMLTEITGEEKEARQKESFLCTTEVLTEVTTVAGFMWLPAGSRLYDDEPIDRLAFKQRFEACQKKGPAEIAGRFLNAPYLWGGKTVCGIDCSGLVQLAFLLKGVIIPRDVRDQITCGQPVAALSEAKAGDIAFFVNEAGVLKHVGLIYGKAQILHASGSVRLDRLDEKGIYNRSMLRYTHHLYQIRRL